MNKAVKPSTIEEYLDAAPAVPRARLGEMLSCLRAAAPDAQESIKWGMPALSYGTILFIFAAYKRHVSLYPTPAVINAFSRELDGLKTSSSTIQFPLDEPLPVELVGRIAEYRVRRVVEDGATWM